MLLLRLPEESLVRTTPEIRKRLAQAKEWPASTELIAQLLEEVSILAADMRRKKPREIERPEFMRTQRNPMAAAIRMLQATARVHPAPRAA